MLCYFFSANLKVLRGKKNKHQSLLYSYLLSQRKFICTILCKLMSGFFSRSILKYVCINRILVIQISKPEKRRCTSWMQLNTAAAAAAKSLQSCPTLCDPTDGSPSGSPIPEILQARILEWVAISFSVPILLI